MADPSQISQLQAKIAEAKEALHQLMLGNKESEVTFGVNRGTKWVAPKAAELRAYINEMETELVKLGGGRVRGPIYPMGDAR